jgi:amino acid adenylation domain-containing protein
VAAIWEQVLGLEGISREANFFNLGGHSLLATRVMSRVRETFQVEVALRSLFEEPSVAGLAGRIEQALGAAVGVQFPRLQKRARGAELPLSYAQQRLWFLDQLEPGNAFYNIAAAVRLSGRLDHGALRASFQELVRRHEALRTRFSSVAGEAVQLIAESVELEWEEIDLRGLAAGEQERERARLTQEKAQAPFDLAEGPLLRLSLLQLGDEEQVLLLVMHHIISDGWSLGVLMREVATLYQSYCEGKAGSLPELAIQYADYASWQREWLTEEVLAGQLEYWREQLAGVPALLELPSDRPRPALQSYQGATESIELGTELSAALQALSQREGVTLFTTLLAAFQTLLARYSGQKEIVVGSPIANRRHVETEELVGCFVNTLVLRSQLADNPRFSELLQRTWAVVIGAHAHQDVPFEKLVEALQPERDLSRAPLFQVMFVLQNASTGSIKLPGLELSLLPSDSGTARFDLTLSLAETADGLTGMLEYNTDLFERERMERLLGHFKELLAAVVRAPAERVFELPLMGAAERRQVLHEWNETERGYEAVGGMHELFERQVERSGTAVAVRCGAAQLSYTELNERANQVAHQLLALGVTAETRVGLLLGRKLELLVSLLGVLKAGGAYVPLDPAYPEQRLRYMLADAGVQVLLTETQWQERVTVAAGVEVVLVGAEAQREYERHNPAVAVAAENLAYVIYTSGSTGAPKGVAIRHGSAVTLLQWAQAEFGAEALQAVLAATSINFDLSVFELLAPLSGGGTVVLVENALELATLAEREQLTLLNTVPSAMTELVRLRAIPAAVQVINLAGEALSRSLVEEIYAQAPQAAVVNLYGPTEDTTYSTWERVRQEPGAVVRIGRPLAETRVYVVGEQWQPAPLGVWGELYLGGGGLARGYLGRAELTAEKFVPDPFSGQVGARLYRTGDVARYGADGRLEYQGRKDQQVKLRGYRIELGEVETHLRRQAGVQAAAVVVSERAEGERQLVAYVVAAAGVELTGSELRAGLRQSLPEYMVPQVYVWLAELPLTANGKLDRQRLPAAAVAAEAEPGALAPQNEIERAVAAIWEQVLGLEGISREANFFNLGGHSLLATRVMYELRERFNVELSLRVLFESPTVAEVAEVIENASNTAAAIQPLVRQQYRVKASMLPAVSKGQNA